MVHHLPPYTIIPFLSGLRVIPTRPHVIPDLIGDL